MKLSVLKWRNKQTQQKQQQQQIFEQIYLYCSLWGFLVDMSSVLYLEERSFERPASLTNRVPGGNRHSQLGHIDTVVTFVSSFCNLARL